MNRNPGQFVLQHLALPGVHARSQLETQADSLVNNGCCASDRTRRPIERSKESVACGIDLASPIALQLASHQSMMALEEFPPSPIAELRDELG
jgi:hypothetical protein